MSPVMMFAILLLIVVGTVGGAIFSRRRQQSTNGNSPLDLLEQSPSLEVCKTLSQYLVSGKKSPSFLTAVMARHSNPGVRAYALSIKAILASEQHTVDETIAESAVNDKSPEVRALATVLKDPVKVEPFLKVAVGNILKPEYTGEGIGVTAPELLTLGVKMNEGILDKSGRIRFHGFTIANGNDTSLRIAIETCIFFDPTTCLRTGGVTLPYWLSRHLGSIQPGSSVYIGRKARSEELSA